MSTSEMWTHRYISVFAAGSAFSLLIAAAFLLDVWLLLASALCAVAGVIASLQARVRSRPTETCGVCRDEIRYLMQEYLECGCGISVIGEWEDSLDYTSLRDTGDRPPLSWYER